MSETFRIGDRVKLTPAYRRELCRKHLGGGDHCGYWTTWDADALTAKQGTVVEIRLLDIRVQWDDQAVRNNGWLYEIRHVTRIEP